MNIPRGEFWTKVDKRCSHVNVGYGEDVTIRELAGLIKRVVGFQGELEFDHSRPDGSPQKMLNSKLVNDLGWSPSTKIENGLDLVTKEFIERAPPR